MIVIGELINSARASVYNAIQSRDEAALIKLAETQKQHGAKYIDVNCSALGAQEAEYLAWLISLIQDNVDVAISIDSPNAETILTVIDRVKGKPVINSVTADSPILAEIFDVGRDRQAKVIGLCMTGTSLPATADEAQACAERLMSSAHEASFPVGDLLLDPLVRAVSTDPSAPRLFLSSLAAIKSLSEDVRTVCGLSNISYGMPARRALNQAFLPLAIMHGLDAVIMDPTDSALVGILHAALALAKPETGVMDYLSAFRSGLVHV